MKVKDFLPLIKEDKAADIQKKIEEEGFNVNSQDEGSGYTLLMYAVSYHCPKTIKALVTLGANPFLVNELGGSAFSLAIKESNESVAKQFLQLKAEKLSESLVSKHLVSEDEDNGAFCYSIASDISKSDSELRKLLGQSAQVSYIHAVREAEALGQDTSDLDYVE